MGEKKQCWGEEGEEGERGEGDSGSGEERKKGGIFFFLHIICNEKRITHHSVF